MGNDGSNNEGIIPFAVQDIFQRCEVLTQQEGGGYQTKLTISYLEIYKEECYDLLSASTRTKCEIREGSKGETYVEGLTHREVTTANDVYRLLGEVSKLRATAKTAMNSQSSRSHAICTFNLKTIKTQTSEETGISTTVTTSCSLNLVDLAGSERVKKTHASGDVFAEGVNINKGLLALGNVIVALSSAAASKENQGNPNHVPYRDSKITRILKDSLGGNSMTVMIACVSPADSNFEETLNTLRFASRVSCIVNTISLNKEYAGDLDSSSGSAGNQQLLQEICHLREQLQLLQSKANDPFLFALEEAAKALPSAAPSVPSLALENVIPLISFIKNILIKCLEDDVLVEDEILDKATVTLQNIKQALNLSSSASSSSASASASASVAETEELGLGFDFLPPIMKLIESFEKLERWSEEQQQQLLENSYRDLKASTTATGGSSSSSRSKAIQRKSRPLVLPTSSSSVSEPIAEEEEEEREGEGEGEDDEEDSVDGRNLELMSSREKEVESMLRLATQVSYLPFCRESPSLTRFSIFPLFSFSLLSVAVCRCCVSLV
jgi:hypothetical protein